VPNRTVSVDELDSSMMAVSSNELDRFRIRVSDGDGFVEVISHYERPGTRDRTLAPE
jgi:hypothetical protein